MRWTAVTREENDIYINYTRADGTQVGFTPDMIALFGEPSPGSFGIMLKTGMWIPMGKDVVAALRAGLKAAGFPFVDLTEPPEPPKQTWQQMRQVVLDALGKHPKPGEN